jgi:hypothetical protein
MHSIWEAQALGEADAFLAAMSCREMRLLRLTLLTDPQLCKKHGKLRGAVK